MNISHSYNQMKISHWCTLFGVSVLSLLFMPGLLRTVTSYLTGAMSSAYQPASLSMAFVTVPNQEVAKKLASGLVTSKLVACVNIIPGVKSIYEWEGKIEEDEELILMIKTRTSHIEDVSKFVRENHPYDTAEVISSLIDNGNPPYLKWIGDIVPEKEELPTTKSGVE